MTNLKALFFLLLTYNSNGLMADEVVIPKAGEDTVLTQGLSVKEYFEKRALPSSCRSQWESAWNKYHGLKSELDQLVSSHASASAMDAKEAEVIKFRRNSLFQLTEECGPCATQEVATQTVHAPTGAQEWFVTDGSCYFPKETKEAQNTAFDHAVEFLSNTAAFARQRGGFESILEFVPVNRRTGAFLPHLPKIASGSTVDTFIAVRGPGRVAFNYLFENRVNMVESPDGTRECIIQFTGLPRPSGFSPKIYDITLAGTKRSISFKWDISRVKGMWYVRNDGYYRYFTAADFEMPLTVGISFARVTLLDTVMTLGERGK